MSAAFTVSLENIISIDKAENIHRLLCYCWWFCFLHIFMHNRENSQNSTFTYLFFISVRCDPPQFLTSKTTTIITAIIASTVTAPNTPPTIAAVLSPSEDTISNLHTCSEILTCYIEYFGVKHSTHLEVALLKRVPHLQFLVQQKYWLTPVLYMSLQTADHLSLL